MFSCEEMRSWISIYRSFTETYSHIAHPYVKHLVWANRP
jgi:hypothetical protein